jgi:DeoR/GlpR family transcriptional regulator of sugar metabolism
MGTRERDPLVMGDERRRLILDLLRAEGRVLAAELAAEFR